jgi:GNAT superfamily N-acetyltransferase
MADAYTAADPALMARWAEAWAISRGAELPVERDGGLYIHVGQPDQIGRYIFATLDAPAIAPLARSIDRPLLYLKMCAPADHVRPLLPEGWVIATPGYMMTAALSLMLDRPPAIPDGLRLDLTRDETGIVFASIVGDDGDEAARGRIVPMGDMIVFDRIHTAEGHQRRGLGSAIMRALAIEGGRLGATDAMLCATPAGRALYTSLGWDFHSDYTTASLAA